MNSLFSAVREIYARESPVFRRTESHFRRALSRSLPERSQTRVARTGYALSGQPGRGTSKKGARSIGGRIRRFGVTANQLTLTRLVMATAASLTIGLGSLRGGFVLVALAAVAEVLKATVAKASAPASPRGAFLSSFVEAASAVLLLGGVAWYLTSSQPGRAAVLPLATLGALMLVSHARMTAGSLGFDVRRGRVERAEWTIVLGVGLLFESLLVPMLWVLLGLAIVTAAQRFLLFWHMTAAPQRLPGRRSRSRNKPVRRPSWQAQAAHRRRTQRR
jgi:CDP-diacylglycerol---glycerol-3-phosphate 3-phosphatidyltransferase